MFVSFVPLIQGAEVYTEIPFTGYLWMGLVSLSLVGFFVAVGYIFTCIYDEFVSYHIKHKIKSRYYEIRYRNKPIPTFVTIRNKKIQAGTKCFLAYYGKPTKCVIKKFEYNLTKDITHIDINLYKQDYTHIPYTQMLRIGEFTERFIRLDINKRNHLPAWW